MTFGMSEGKPLKRKAARVMSVYFPGVEDGFRDPDKTKRDVKKLLKLKICCQ